MSRRPLTRSRAGMSLVELLIVLALVGVVMVRTAQVFDSSSDVIESESSSMELDNRAGILLDRIADALMGADRGTLVPIATASHSTSIAYLTSQGTVGGNVVWSDPEQIALGAGNQIVWSRNPGQPDEESIVWSRDVMPLAEGEVANGLDDNGNGLVDEEGLHFVIDGNSVTIRVSLGRMLEDGRMATRTLETTVHCRNNPLEE